MTATFPLPSAATLLRLAIVVKFLSKVLTDTVPDPDDPAEVVDEDELVLLPQAAASSPPASSIGTKALPLLMRMLPPILLNVDFPET